MFYLLLAVLCSLGIGVLFKVVGRYGIDRLGLLTVNYLVAVLIALGQGVDFSLSDGGRETALLLAVGLANGVLFIVGFALYAYAIDRIGLAISAAVMRISVVVPFAASWFIWGEVPGWLQVPGLLLALTAFGLMSVRGARRGSEGSGHAGSGTIVALLFLVAGVTDTVLKVYDEHLATSASEATYLLLVFGGAFVSGVVKLALRRDGGWRTALQKKTLVGGLVLGALNYGSVEFFLRALGELPGTLVYPVNHVAVLLGGTILGVAIWREVLTRSNWIGLALAAVALALLTS